MEDHENGQVEGSGGDNTGLEPTYVEGSSQDVSAPSNNEISGEVVSETFELNVMVEVSPTVNIEPIISDIEEVIERELADSEKIAITKFPPWVSMRLVRRIRQLNCFETVREMVMSGVPSVEVARHIHSVGELLTAKVDTVRQYIEHFKVTIPSWQLAARQQPKQYLDLKQKADAAIDVLSKLTKMYNIMEDRIEIGVAQEKRFQLLTSGMERNIVVAVNILAQIQELKERLGVTDDQAKSALPKHLADQVDWSKIYARESVSRVMSNPEARTRVLQAAERLIDLYAVKLDEKDLKRAEHDNQVRQMSEDADSGEVLQVRPEDVPEVSPGTG